MEWDWAWGDVNLGVPGKGWKYCTGLTATLLK